MKKLLIITAFFALSCEKEDLTTPTEPTTCECYKQWQELAPGGVWVNTSVETPQPELCSKNGTAVEINNYYRYVWHCQ